METEESVIFIQLNKIKILLKALLKQFTNKILYVIIKSQINYLIIIVVHYKVLRQTQGEDYEKDY